MGSSFKLAHLSGYIDYLGLGGWIAWTQGMGLYDYAASRRICLSRVESFLQSSNMVRGQTGRERSVLGMLVVV